MVRKIHVKIKVNLVALMHRMMLLTSSCWLILFFRLAFFNEKLDTTASGASQGNQRFNPFGHEALLI